MKKIIKENCLPLILISLYLIAGIYGFLNMNKFLNSNEFNHSILKEIIDKFSANFIFSVYLSFAIGSILIVLLIFYYIFFKGNPFKGVINFIFVLFVTLFIFMIVIFSLSITTDNAESFIAFIGLVWAMIKFLPLIYKKITAYIKF
mgnify:FL=1